MMLPYTEYQQSDISWLGKVPKHWAKNKFKFLLNEKPKTQNLELPCGSISFGNVVFKDSERLSEETKAAYQEVLTGEFLVNPLNLNYDLKSLRTALADIDVIVSSGYIVLKSLDVVDKAYLRWLLYLFDVRHMKTLGAGIRQTISFKDIADCAVYIPNDSEQKAIAKFLDRETQRIDSLIEEKQTFIKLLKEKRQALISHVVTKGLNPNVEMQDSGIEWIGQVPKHWEMIKFSHFVSIRNGQVDPTIEPWSNRILIAPNHIESGSGKIIKKETAAEQGADSGKYLCKKGEVIYSKIRPALAKACICEEDEAICSADMYPISCDSRMKNEYLLWLILSSEFTRYAILESERIAMPKINRDSLGKIKFPVPPITEQNAALNYIKTNTEKIERLIEHTNTSIELLQEHRISLISAAVTGKIDVREAV
ncbi:restriction endonuclease subunit S [Vibrio metschnikovii]|nr:restriction endonuclease subunit S [Salmonella enterica subsp. enterica serovar Mbandaka]EII5634558.1 restriction endonuclease subunit S [Vibrio cholerae]ELZ5774018.1 restriction endonuclease subunit S [Vibrio metschnikovii]